MKLKIIKVSKNAISAYYFNETDSEEIISRCKKSGKRWSEALLGFFINITDEYQYAAVTMKGDDDIIKSMEYIDIDTNQPEFNINQHFLMQLAKKEENTEISLAEFEPILAEILIAPLKARRFEVYAEINKYYSLLH